MPGLFFQCKIYIWLCAHVLKPCALPVRRYWADQCKLLIECLWLFLDGTPSEFLSRIVASYIEFTVLFA